MAKRDKDKIRVRFVGAASQEVTGSCIHIQTEAKQILLECGLYQSCESPIATYRKNSSDLGFKPKDIDYIFINHMHADHLCLTPRLFKKGCNAKVIAPFGSSAIAKLLLFDSAHIAEKDAEFIEKRTGKFCEPLYSEDDVIETMRRWEEYQFGQVHKLDDEISFRFIPSGHILNSAQLELWITQNNLTKKIAYTSDLGNVSVPKFYVTRFKPIDQCNLFIGETTYSDKTRTIHKKDRDKDLEKIKSVITEKCVNGNGKVLFPVFANDRCQNILTYLYQIFGSDESFTVPVLIDSPMAINISKAYLDLVPEKQKSIYEQAFMWKNVQFLESYEDSKKWQISSTSAIILSCSGMMTNGRSVAWAKRLLPNSQNHILFAGYSSVGSLAAKIKEGKHKSISIEGKSVANRCGITSLSSFSSHMQAPDLLQYYSSVNCEKIALVHGDYDSKLEFSKELQEAISKNDKTSRVICVNKSTEILL